MSVKMQKFSLHVINEVRLGFLQTASAVVNEIVCPSIETAYY